MAKYRISRADSELTAQLEQCRPYFQGNDFNRLLQAQKKFDGTVHVLGEGEHLRDGCRGTPVEHYQLRETLRGIPAYMDAIKSTSLNYEQGVDILLHLFNGDEYTFSQKESDLAILTKALSASREDKTLPQNIDKVKQLMSAGVGGSGMGGSLYAFYLASRLGIPVAGSGAMIANGAEGSYVLGPFNDALKSMLPARPNPELVVQAFDIMNNGGKNYWRSGDYATFEQLMTFFAPGKGISVDNMLAMFISASKHPSRRKQLECPVENRAVTESKEKYFLPCDGRLEPLAQPYVTRRSLSQGLRDLAELATASFYKWQEVGEGFFVFDPKSEMWYSLGGRLELPSMNEVMAGRAERVRHNFLPYDISALSETPFLFHAHPSAFDSFIAPPRESLVDPRLEEPIIRFLNATPSRADYKVVARLMKDAKTKVRPRSFIAHALGITEFTYPYDVSAIEKMGEQSRDIRDQSLLNPPEEAFQLDGFEFVSSMVRDLNTRLPQGFVLGLRHN
jgi:hypothetical protein